MNTMYKSMKLIQEWEDKLYDAKNYIYELPNGLRVLHTVDPKTTDTTINILTKGGAYRDIELGLKKGTAHFVEHMLFGTPNKVFKSDKSMDRFSQGTQRRAAIKYNATTSTQNIVFYGYTHSYSEDRLIKLLYSTLDYPMENFSKYIEKQRKIIIAERSLDRKQSDDELYNYSRFLIEPYLKGYSHNILGEIDDLMNINNIDLEKYYKNIFFQGNVYVSIQSNKEISKNIREYLNKLDTKLGNKKLLIKHQTENCVNQRRIGFFQDKYENGFRIEIITFSPITKQYDYKNIAISKFLLYLLRRVSFLYIREKLGLVYSYSIDHTSSLYYNTRLNYMTMKSSNENSKKLVSHLGKMLRVEIPKYLNSNKCIEWMESLKSSVKFPNTASFDRSYSLKMTYKLIEGYDVFNKEIFIKELMGVTVDDIKNAYQKYIIDIPKHIWIVSDIDEKDIMKNLDLSSII